MDFDVQTLTAAGFTGFRSFAELELKEIPQAPGIYAVLMPEGCTPRFLAGSTGGHFKGKDPSLPQAPCLPKGLPGLRSSISARQAPGGRVSAVFEKGSRNLRTSDAVSRWAIGVAGCCGNSQIRRP